MLGVLDDPILDMIELSPEQRKQATASIRLFDKSLASSEEEKQFYRKKLVKNIKLVRDLMKEIRPETLVVEMCPDRYDRWIADVENHPSYEATMQIIHNVLDKDPNRLMSLESIDVENSNLEYLLGIDYCTYRMPCKPVMGDRSYKTSRKRFESKIQMREVYKEALQVAKTAPRTEAEE